MSALTNNLEPVQALSDAVLVLVFSAMIALGWLNWLPLGVVIAAVVLPFAIRRNARAQAFAPWASVYAGVSAFVIPPFVFSNILERLSWMALGTILAYLIGLAFDGVIEKNRFAWLSGLLLLVINPSALGVVGVLGLGLLGAMGARASRIRIGIQHQTRSGLIVLTVVGVTLASLSILFVHPADLHLENSRTSTAQAAIQLKPKTVDPATPKILDSVRPRSKPNLSQDNLQTILMLSNVLLLLLMSALVLVLLQKRLQNTNQKPKLNWTELIPLFGALIVVLALFLWASTVPPGTGIDQTSQTQNNSSNPTRASDSKQVQTAPALSGRSSPTISLVMLLVVLAVAYYVYRLSREKSYLEASENPEILADSSLEARIRASNRVREAYKAFLEHCDSQAIRRSLAQTPLEFAGQVLQLVPNVQNDVLKLTHLYEPVRYGQLSDESGAFEAERLAQALKSNLKLPQNPGETA